MDVTVAGTIIATGGSLFGAGLGGLISYLTTSRMHAKQVLKERHDARRVREHEAMKQCEALCVSMANDMEHARHPLNVKHDDEYDQREDRVIEAYHQLRATSLYLPERVRTRVEDLADIVSDTDDIAYGTGSYGPTHYDRPYGICSNVQSEIRRLTAAVLKDELLPAPKQIIVEYVAAVRALERDRDEIYADREDPAQGQRQRNKEEFYRRHPELAPDFGS